MADIQDIEKLPEKMADWEIREIIGEGDKRWEIEILEERAYVCCRFF